MASPPIARAICGSASRGVTAHREKNGDLLAG
jgi:hypothetical protein